jgi:hypothetical protein
MSLLSTLSKDRPLLDLNTSKEEQKAWHETFR